jgi:hypothetical protein
MQVATVALLTLIVLSGLRGATLYPSRRRRRLVAGEPASKPQ